MYLAIIKRQGNQWVVDEDSAHLFGEEEGITQTIELKIASMRVIGAKASKIPDDKQLSHLPPDFRTMQIR